VFDLNGFAETIGSLQLHSTNAGAHVSTGTGTLTLAGNVDLLTESGAALGAMIAGNLDLGNATRTFTIGDGTASVDLDITAVVSNGGLIKAGLGPLRLEGANSNTYAGLTTVNAGRLELNKIGNPTLALAIPGDLTINGGTVRELASDQIADSSTVT